jgi:hypothetical protein
MIEDNAATRALEGVNDWVAAIDQIVGAARKRLRIFDRNLADGGYNSPGRQEGLRTFLLSNRDNRIEIVVHSTNYIERDCVRLQLLLRQFSYAIQIHRTLAEAKHVQDAFIVADEHAYAHRFHVEQPRGEIATGNEVKAELLLRRYEEIWAASEPGLSATVLGL